MQILHVHVTEAAKRLFARHVVRFWKYTQRSGTQSLRILSWRS